MANSSFRSLARRPLQMAAILAVLAAPALACERAETRVAIDVGHYRDAPGATSARGVPEYDFNLRLARRVYESLGATGFGDRILIGESGEPISIRDRVDIANRAEADVFVSIHHDSVQPQFLSEWMHGGRRLRYSDRYRGFSLFVSGENPAFDEGRRLAGLIADGLIADGFRPTLHHAEPIEGENRDLLDPERGVYRWDRLGVVRSTRMPAALFEAGVIVNRDEEAELSEPAVQARIGAAVAGAIDAFVCGPGADAGQ